MIRESTIYVQNLWEALNSVHTVPAVLEGTETISKETELFLIAIGLKYHVIFKTWF